MSFRSNARSNVARYAQAGKAAANAGVQISGGIAKNRPRYDRIENERMTANAEQFRAAVRADAQVAEAGIKAKARIDITKTAIDRDKSIAASKKSARKAGMIAAGVGAIGGGLMMQNRKEEVNPMLKSYQDRIGYYDSKMSDYDKQITDQESLIEGMEAPEGYKPSSSGSSTSGTQSSSTQSSSTSTKPVSGGSVGLQVMQKGIDMGMTPQAAAAMAGNSQYESANFTAHEEFAPNSYGTKGAGYLQWTNAGGSNRRSNFESWASSQGLDPRSHEANIGFLTHELQGGQHWTSGRNTKDFSAMTDVATATREFQNHYLRPADLQGSLDQRTSNAQALLNQWQQLQN
tara:strand:- start:792 stop:1829 length:1038 start_codon:yes stop_codon:yes gene_type:complete